MIISIVLITFLCVSGCRQKPEKLDITSIKQKLNDFDDVDEFVTWLKVQSTVTNVTHDKRTFMTSTPPKQVVTFFLDGVQHRFLLTVDVGAKVKLLKPTLEELDRLKN